jgi:excisionase family DNA binding protein
MKKFVDVNQFAEWVGVDTSTIRRHLSQGTLGFTRVGCGRKKGAIRISIDELDRFIRERSVPARCYPPKGYARIFNRPKVAERT